MREIGYLQLDPTNVVARSQLLVLFSRVGPYDWAALDRLLWRDRRLFEYARGAAFIFPTDDLPILANAMRQYRQAKTPRAQRMAAWIRKNDSLRRHVLSRLRADRERSRLVIGSVHAEPDAPTGRSAAIAIREAVEDLAEFVGAGEIECPRSIPSVWFSSLHGRRVRPT